MYHITFSTRIVLRRFNVTSKMKIEGVEKTVRQNERSAIEKEKIIS